MINPLDWVLVVPDQATKFIAETDAGWGFLNLKIDETENVVLVTSVWRTDKAGLQLTSPWLDSHYLKSADPVPRAGRWYRVKPELHTMHDMLVRRPRTEVTLDYFKSLVIGQYQPAGNADVPILTVAFDAEDAPTIAAWWTAGGSVSPAPYQLVTGRSPLEFLKPNWPVEQLAHRHITIVGVGSIGSAAAAALARYGIGRVSLFDHDRLSEHNLPRHQLSVRDVGRYKVAAMAELLKNDWPDLTVTPVPLNVSTAADVARPLFAASDVVVCAADGVTARKVSNHLARRAAVPLVLASVKEFGALGEIVRVAPGTGCLSCFRADLVRRQVMDPEPRMDRDYGTGDLHLPMTAVGSDLTLIGTLAAKVAVATILERDGDRAQALENDILTIGLRPVPDLDHPYDIERALGMRWAKLPESDPNCPTCHPISFASPETPTSE